VNQTSPAKKTALCGTFAALAVALLYLGSLTVLDMTILAVCALMTMVMVVEIGPRAAWLYVCVTGVLALLLLPNKLYAVEYVGFSAVYPILKMYLEKWPRAFAWIGKIAVLDLMLLGCVLLAQKILLLGEEYFSLSLLTFGLGTAFFVLYDHALSVCVTTYIVKVRKRLKMKK